MIHIRTYNPDEDLTALHQLLTAVETHDQDGEDVSIETLRQQLTWRNYNPRLDSFVAEQATGTEGLVGFASIAGRTGTRCTAYAAVHPDWRRHGFGTQLLNQALARAKESGSDNFIIYANGHNIAANAFLKERAYQPVGASWILEAPADTSFAKPVFPEGFSIRSYAQFEKPEILADILNRGYSDMWGHGQNETPTTAKSLSEIIPSYWQQEHIFLLFAPDGEVAGVCLGIPDENEHILEGSGIAPEYRHLELQRPLTLTLAHHLQAIQQKPIHLLSYGDTQATIDIYQQIGFNLTVHFIAYYGNI